jgi:HEPN domain-containing protein
MDLICKWFNKAKDDFIVARHLFEDLFPKQIEIICYHAQQSTEKALKGFLIYNDIDVPKTHDLVALCRMCAKIDQAFKEKIDDCAVLTLYSSITRYPNEIEMDENEAASAIEKAQGIYDFCVGMIPELNTQEQKQGPTIPM